MSKTQTKSNDVKTLVARARKLNEELRNIHNAIGEAGVIHLCEKCGIEFLATNEELIKEYEPLSEEKYFCFCSKECSEAFNKLNMLSGIEKEQLQEALEKYNELCRHINELKKSVGIPDLEAKKFQYELYLKERALPFICGNDKQHHKFEAGIEPEREYYQFISNAFVLNSSDIIKTEYEGDIAEGKICFCSEACYKEFEEAF